MHLQRSEKISPPFARDGINGTDIGSVRGGRLSSHRRTHTIIFLSPVTPTADAPLSLFPFAFHALLPSIFIPIPLLLLLPNNKTGASAALWGKDEGKGEGGGGGDKGRCQTKRPGTRGNHGIPRPRRRRPRDLGGDVKLVLCGETCSLASEPRALQIAQRAPSPLRN